MAFDRQFGRASDAFADELVKELQVRQAKRVLKSALSIGIGAAIAIFFAGWIFFLTYNAFRPDAWPYIGLWTAFGLSWLFKYVVNVARGV